MLRQNVLETACTWNKSKKATNSNNQASPTEMVLEKHKKGKTTLSSDFLIYFEGSQCVLYVVATQLSVFFLQSEHKGHQNYWLVCQKPGFNVSLQSQLYLLFSDSQQDMLSFTSGSITCMALTCKKGILIAHDISLLYVVNDIQAQWTSHTRRWRAGTAWLSQI